MPHFKLKVEGLATGATANAFITLLGLKFANTTGHRGRLRKLDRGRRRRRSRKTSRSACGSAERTTRATAPPRR